MSPGFPEVLDEHPFLTDGGLETTLIFHKGIDLPSFASFVLLKDESGRQALRDYFEPYLALAAERGTGFVLDTATWRANPDWGRELGYSPEELERANRDAVALAAELRAKHQPEVTPIMIDGVIGPRGDGYVADTSMSAEEAERYHSMQARVFAEAGADLVSAITMTYAEEAAGIVRAARAAGIPVAVSFTVETDGRLPSGQRLREAIEQVDAQTDGGPDYYMVNCAHPTHFLSVLEEGGPWLERIRGIRANASRMSHAELDDAEELDEGNPSELAGQYRELRERLPKTCVLGGCCGTDHRHVREIAVAAL
jgi:S-methylmethionine-dependent homocysteine/selenocysteine methylase